MPTDGDWDEAQTYFCADCGHQLGTERGLPYFRREGSRLVIPYQFEPIGRHSDIQVMDAGLQDFEVSVLPVFGLLRGICVIGSGPQVQPPPRLSATRPDHEPAR